MIRPITRLEGTFHVEPHEFVNLYFSVLFQGEPCASVHLQLNLKEKYAYCHIYLDRFSPSIAKELKKDWKTLQHVMRTYGIKKAIGTKQAGIPLWSKFIKMLGFADEAEEITMNEKPCMMAIMEF